MFTIETKTQSSPIIECNRLSKFHLFQCNTNCFYTAVNAMDFVLCCTVNTAIELIKYQILYGKCFIFILLISCKEYFHKRSQSKQIDWYWQYSSERVRGREQTYKSTGNRWKILLAYIRIIYFVFVNSTTSCRWALHWPILATLYSQSEQKSKLAQQIRVRSSVKLNMRTKSNRTRESVRAGEENQRIIYFIQ